MIDNKKIAKDAHNKALKKAKKKLEVLNAQKAIEIANSILRGEITKEEAFNNCKKEIYDAAIIYVSNFEKNFLTKEIKQRLKNSDNDNLKSLSKTDYAKETVESINKVFPLLMSLANAEIDLSEFICKVSDTNIDKALIPIIKEYSNNAKEFDEVLEKMMKQKSTAIAYACFVEAYEILMEALNDASIAFEHRLEVEKECQRNVEMIKRYHKNLEESITGYFSKYQSTFEYGFAMMDEALIDNDSNKYIKGNVEIQKLLNYDIQFYNQEEFNILMESDIEFKL